MGHFDLCLTPTRPGLITSFPYTFSSPALDQVASSNAWSEFVTCANYPPMSTPISTMTPHMPSSLSSSSPSSTPPSSPLPDSSIPELRELLTASPTYDNYYTLISALRRSADLPALRLAREQFSVAHPLSPALWREWLEDELRIAQPADRFAIHEKLFPRAVRDFVDVGLHKMRLELAVELFENGRLTRDDVHSVLQEAVWMGALHCPEGENIWETYKAFLQSGGETVENRIHLVDGCLFMLDEEVQREAQVFEEKVQGNDDEYEGKSNEERVMRYRSYAAYAKGISEGLTISVYERLVRECFGDGEVWAEYVQYALGVGRKGFARFVSRRAMRNVPWQMSVWHAALLTVNDAEELSDVLKLATEITQQSEDYEGAEMLSKEAWSMFLATGGPAMARESVMKSLEFNLVGSVNWARACMFAAGVLVELGEVDSAIEAMEWVVKIRGAESRWWIEFAGVLERVKLLHEGRNVFRRGMSLMASVEAVNDLTNAWFGFECHCGERDALASRIARVQMTAADKLEVIRRNRTFDLERVENAAGKKKEREKGRNRALPKRKRARALAAMEAGKVEEDKAKALEDKMEESSSGDASADKPVSADIANGKGEMKNEQKRSKENEGTEEVARKKGNIVSGEIEPRTIFINNLAFNVSEDDLRENFSFAGNIVSIRLPRRSDGASKGIAYVEFGDEESVEKALSKHQTSIKGRIVWVRRSKPPKKKQRKIRAQARESVRTKVVGSGLMQPRVVQRRGVVQTPDKTEASGDTTMRDDEESGKTTPKSQADFRAMFLQK